MSTRHGTRHWPTLALVSLLAAGCASTPTPPRAEFVDVPIPAGLTYRADDSAMIESPTVKAARYLYRSRLQPDSLIAVIRTSLEGSGWRHVSGTGTPAHGATQLYQKGNDTLQVRVWEGGLFDWYTYVEYAAARVTPGSVSATPR
jgi:hypothetical protein